MSILIKGVDSLASQKFIVDEKGAVWISQWPTRGYRRMDNVEIVSVPTPHGRLVDLYDVNRIIESLRDRNIDNDDMVFVLNWAEEVIKKLPTIIEAEEAHNGE